jgi:hypothetical protein
MAIKTFTTGEVLTAADTNTYLANSGLVFVKQQAITNSAEIVISSCFNATFTSYQIVFSQAKHATTATNIQFRMRNASTNETGSVYYDARTSISYAAAAVVNASTNGLTISTLAITLSASNTVGATILMDNPFGTDRTSWFNQGGDSRTDGAAKFSSGFINTATSYDSISINPASGSFAAGGTITVYGYRKG